MEGVFALADAPPRVTGSARMSVALFLAFFRPAERNVHLHAADRGSVRAWVERDRAQRDVSPALTERILFPDMWARSARFVGGARVLVALFFLALVWAGVGQPLVPLPP